MAFSLDVAKVLQSSLLETQPWLRHGFGTRQSTGWPGSTATLRQTHSDIVVTIGKPCKGEQGEGDALLTGQHGVAVSIRTADCVPVLLADPVSKAIAAIHAGWKGTSKSIVRKALERMEAEYGTRPRDVLAAIGPCIGPCCYEVSQDVAEQFQEYMTGPVREGKSHLDLAAINRRQLEQAGVPRVDVANICTKCNVELYHSYRRDGDQSGRMHAAIGIRP